MKSLLLSRLRNKEISLQDFRRAAEELSDFLAFEALSHLPTQPTLIKTPLKEIYGKKFANEQVVIPILRAGLSMLPAFLKVLPQAKVGFLGMKRNEETFIPRLYYQNLPTIRPTDDILLLDPMIATGGSGKMALDIIKEMGGDLSRVIYVGMVASPEGLEIVRLTHPAIKIVVGAVDEGLNSQKYIVPGLGDFGDRFFGTE